MDYSQGVWKIEATDKMLPDRVQVLLNDFMNTPITDFKAKREGKPPIIIELDESRIRGIYYIEGEKKNINYIYKDFDHLEKLSRSDGGKAHNNRHTVSNSSKQVVWYTSDGKKISSVNLQKILNDCMVSDISDFTLPRNGKPPLFLKLNENRVSGLIFERQADGTIINTKDIYVKEIYEDVSNSSRATSNSSRARATRNSRTRTSRNGGKARATSNRGEHSATSNTPHQPSMAQQPRRVSFRNELNQSLNNLSTLTKNGQFIFSLPHELIPEDTRREFNLLGAKDGIQRFMIEQNKHFQKALDEINRGRKMTHWIWYIIPQPFNLDYNTTPKSAYFALSNQIETVQYLQHPKLLVNLHTMFSTIEEQITIKNIKAEQLFGPDKIKVKSSIDNFLNILQTHFKKEIQNPYEGVIYLLYSILTGLIPHFS